MSKHRRLLFLSMIVLLLGLVQHSWAAGSEPAANETTDTKPARSPLATAGIAIGAALAIGLCALGTGIAQSRIGAAGAGTIAEKPEATGTMILLLAIPETMVILGFVIAVILLFTL